MTLVESVLSKLKSLPPDKQVEVLDFIEFLQQKKVPKAPAVNLKGLWAAWAIDISDADIKEARGQMWAKFSGEPS